MKENEFTNAGYKEVGSRKCKKKLNPYYHYKVSTKMTGTAKF